MARSRAGNPGRKRLASGEVSLIDNLARLVRAACLAALVLAVPAPSASAATRLVDDDKAECPNAGFTTIQAAVDDAEAHVVQPGDEIAICPGLYVESLVVNSPLTLRGAGAGLVRIEPDAAGSIVTATGGGPVEISGVTIAGNSQAATTAVSFVETSGAVERSRLTDLGLSANGVRSVVNGPTSRSLGVGGSLIEEYGTYGVHAETTSGDLVGTVQNSVVRGRGPISTAGAMQDGVQVVGPNSRATIQGNLITDHRNTADEADGAAVRLFDASAATSVTGNDLQGNGYGVFRGDGTGACDVFPAPPTDVNAENNWWGSPSGPTLEPKPPLCLAPVTSSSPADRVNSGVDYTPHSATPHGAPIVPAQQPDGPPTVAITSPADGAEGAPGTPVTVSASASDDFDIAKVEFRRGATLVESVDEPPYSSTVTAPAAGASQVVTATAVDSSGQSDANAISLRGALPQQPDTPQAPAEPEDRPPSVAITGPAPGAQIDPVAAPRLTADAGDDRGVARVVFLDDGQQVCSDDTAPYDCAYAPNGGDVGRNTLIAIAVDGAGQSAVDFRGVEVRRFNPKLTARTTPKRDRRRPYRYTTTGSVLLPAGVTPAQACSGGGSVAIEFRVGKLRLPQTATLRPDCSFRTSIAFPSRRSLGNGRIAISAKFGGNTVLGTAKAPSQKVRAG